MEHNVEALCIICDNAIKMYCCSYFMNGSHAEFYKKELINHNLIQLEESIALLYSLTNNQDIKDLANIFNKIKGDIHESR